MAAPAERTVRDLNGVWVLNKHLSDDIHPLLKLQNISWLLRQAITLATISLHTVQTPTPTQTNKTNDAAAAAATDGGGGIITIQNIANMGLKGTTEIRHLDWQWREHRDYIWGQVRGRCGFKAMQDVADERLREGWLEETLRGECIQEDAAAGDESWESTMIWGFQNIDSVRHFVRRVVVQRNNNKNNNNKNKSNSSGGDNTDAAEETASVRLVYDYQGPVVR